MPDINTLRNHLFSTLNALQDKENPMDIERARAISDVAQTIINTAKVEIDHMKLTGGNQGSGFIPLGLDHKTTTPTGHGVQLVEKNAAGATITHRMR